MKRKLLITGLVIAGIAIAGLIAYAALSQNWPFTTDGDYTVYKCNGTQYVQDTTNSDIIVADGVAKLSSTPITLRDDTITLYNTGTLIDAGGDATKNKDVRDLLGKSGIRPEALPPEEDIKKLQRGLKSEGKKIAKEVKKIK